MKIPTLLGIAMVITLVALGGLYYYYAPDPKPDADFQVSNLQVVNISNTSATVVWQTSSPATGEVEFGQFEQLSEKSSDNRDRTQPQARSVHFVTLNKLKPNTSYSYKIKNNDTPYPDKALGFKTANIPEAKAADLTFSFIKPLKGTVLNTNLNPIDESLIFLKIPGVQDLATFSSTAGNFILPLKSILNKELDKVFIVPPDSLADLTIIKGSFKSDVKIKISKDTINLPPIPIGANLDLTNFKSPTITKITFKGDQIEFDFNGDSKINSLDMAILREAAGSARGTDTQSRFDINGDGIIDQKDIDIFSKALK